MDEQRCRSCILERGEVPARWNKAAGITRKHAPWLCEHGHRRQQTHLQLHLIQILEDGRHLLRRQASRHLGLLWLPGLLLLFMAGTDFGFAGGALLLRLHGRLLLGPGLEGLRVVPPDAAA